MKIRIVVNAAKRPEKKPYILPYLALLTFMFLLVQISFIMRSSQLFFGDFEFISRQLHLPLKMIVPILVFTGIVLILHVLWTFMVWGLARLYRSLWSLSWPNTERLAYTLWGMTLVYILLFNQYYFPNSRFADLTSILIWGKPAAILLFSVTVCLALVLMGVLIPLSLKIGAHAKRTWIWGSLAVVFFLGLINWIHPGVHYQDGATNQQPNVIIIGIDSLRPDILHYFGGREGTPHIDHFLKEATVFADAYTPLARTFPSWIGILTGSYPLHTHARTDLEKREHLNLQNSLSTILKAHGYETIFAMDETRFSNIDTSYGFDHVITPPVGVDDFLLGSASDLPLTNALVNTRLGRILFPFSYGNRPAYVSYDPDSFISLMKKSLPSNRSKPVFLAAHFCLPHTPYIWSDYHEVPHDHAYQKYLSSIHRADRQVFDFLTLLKKEGYLEHSIVVLLSDHGEAIELHGDRITTVKGFMPHHAHQAIPHFYPKSYDTEAVDQSVGHGTDVLGLTQYHSLLAIRTKGFTANIAHAVKGPVSLLDIKATVLALLHLPEDHADGVSLQPWVVGHSTKVSMARDLFSESDFSPPSIRTVHPELRKVMLDGILYFELNPNTLQLSVKPSMEELINTSKQHAIMHGDWMLALYPEAHKPSTPVLINLKTGQWTNDLNTAFAKKSPANEMLKTLKGFYGSEIH